MSIFQQLLDELSLFDDWEERYSYIIDLSLQLPEFPEIYKNDAHKVDGCMSQVWLYCTVINNKVVLHGTSDAIIVRGLIAILYKLCHDVDKDVVRHYDFDMMFRELGFSNHLSPNRRNGFYAMMERIKHDITQ